MSSKIKDAQMFNAVMSGNWTKKAIGDRFGVHPSTVTRAEQRVRKRIVSLVLHGCDIDVVLRTIGRDTTRHTVVRVIQDYINQVHRADEIDALTLYIARVNLDDCQR